jgi:AmmeMemoRadiSam system protein A
LSILLNLSDSEKQYLLSLARTVIIHDIRGESYQPEKPPSENLRIKSGIFVTLEMHKQLRGCIGYVEGVRPLYEAVADMARSAAFEDPRFTPVQEDEIDAIEIEISVLSPLQQITSTDEIEVGVHGLIIEQGIYKGLLLPQVAVEYGWDRETFLQHTCQKAGLPPEAWKESTTKISVFSAEIFSEEMFS